jgi:NADP-dependent 3-hydroxy acid dehydrogenase YdfG
MDVPGFALITGAASGIGKACATVFARDGAAGIALLDINNDAIAAVKKQIEQQCTGLKSHVELKHTRLT